MLRQYIIIAFLVVSVILLAGCINTNPVYKDGNKTTSASAKILSHNSFRYGDNGIAIVGIVENTGNATLAGGISSLFDKDKKKTRLFTSFHDASGKLIDVEDEYNTIWMDTLRHDEKSPFMICHDGTNVANYTIELRSEVAESVEYVRFKITSHSIALNSSEDANIIGQIKTDPIVGESSLPGTAKIAAVVYDREGKIAQISTKYIHYNETTSGSTEPFEIPLLKEKICSFLFNNVNTGILITNESFLVNLNPEKFMLINETKYELFAQKVF